MKKYFFLTVFALCLSIFVQAQTPVTTPVTVATTAGNLFNDLKTLVGTYNSSGYERLNPVSDLTVIGTLNVQDFSTLVQFKSSLVKLNLSGVTAIDGGSIPDNAFYNASQGLYFTLLENVILPAFPGLSIGASAFANCPKLASVTFNEGLTEIKDYAFQGCTVLAGVTNPLPASLITLGKGVFKNTALTAFVWSSGLTTIPAETFAQTKLQNFTVPATVVSIGNSAFYYCLLLETVTFAPRSAQLTVVGTAFALTPKLQRLDFPANTVISGSTDNMFQYTTALTEVTGLPAGTPIGRGMFQNSGIQSFTVPAGVSVISADAFNGASKLTSIDLQDVTTINNAAFKNTTVLTAVDLSKITTFNDNEQFSGSGVVSVELPAATLIKQATFKNCKALTSVKLGANVSAIMDEAFYGCSAITALELPKMISTIGNSAFENMTGLRSLTVYRTGNPINFSSVGDRVFNGIDKSLCKLYVPVNRVQAYKDAYLWGDFENIVGLEQTISGLSDISKTYGDANFDLSATASSGLPVAYTSTNTSVATVSGSMVTIVGAGTTTITASQAGNTTWNAATPVTAVLTVSALKVNAIRLGLSLSQGSTAKLTAAVSPANASNTNVNWSSDNAGVASVDNNGNVSAISAGPAIITVASADGAINVEFAITVIAEVTTAYNAPAAESNFSFNLQPNPVVNEARFYFESAGNGASIVLSDLNGKVIVRKSLQVGVTKTSMAVANLSKGVYMVNYSDNNGKRATVKMIK